MLIDGIPEAQLCSDAVVEPVQDLKPVGSLWGGGQTKELLRTHVVEQSPVRRSRRVVELIHDDHIKVIWIEVGKAACVQTLDRCKHVVEVPRPRSANPLLPEGLIAKGVAEGSQTLVQDLLAMRDEEES